MQDSQYLSFELSTITMFFVMRLIEIFIWNFTWVFLSFRILFVENETHCRQNLRGSILFTILFKKSLPWIVLPGSSQ